MNRNAVAVFGVIRYADELELSMVAITQRSGLRWRQVAAALRDLRAAGLVVRRRENSECFYGLAIHDGRRDAA